jgi:hypothetical protein
MATASNLPQQVVLREIISSTGVGGVLGKEPYTSKTGCMNLPSLTSIIDRKRIPSTRRSACSFPPSGSLLVAR